jgi:hypothetical protein
MTRLTRASIMLTLSAFALIGCSSSSSSGSAATQPSTGSQDTAAATDSAAQSTGTNPLTATPTSTAAGQCPTDIIATVTNAAANSAITKVELIGGCTYVNISTSLANDDIKTALDICDAAAKVAYVDRISSIAVMSSTQKELSIGVKGTQCIGEP